MTITTTLAFAGLTFLSRLADFHVSYPEIDIRVIESDERLDFDVDGIDLAPTDIERVAVGMEAPDFSLASITGETVTLSSFRGAKNVILVFYRGHW